ncbi:UNKNOWN [Stylonychia lemnae]|uniref:Uncharacterized protein n=1 Tax=Stylonychia lemnae TaxID=5949 RepID=A0A078A958_STYLE|nr:UNKNOWN [Stylonychia lemnae]|eukprot:CDW78376.1 UNKNOWN [Stylonychia lemnae]
MQIQDNIQNFSFLVNSDERDQGVSNRYGSHKLLVKRTQLRDKIRSFLAPRHSEIPQQPRRDNAKQLEYVPLSKTFVPFLNERNNVGQIRTLLVKQLFYSTKRYNDKSDDPYNGDLRSMNKTSIITSSRNEQSESSSDSEAGDYVMDNFPNYENIKFTRNTLDSRDKKQSVSQINLLNLEALRPNHDYQQQIAQSSSEILRLRQRSGSLLRGVANPIMFGLASRKISEQIQQDLLQQSNRESLLQTINNDSTNETTSPQKQSNSRLANNCADLNTLNPQSLISENPYGQIIGNSKLSQIGNSNTTSQVAFQNQNLLKEQQAKLLAKLLPKSQTLRNQSISSGGDVLDQSGKSPNNPNVYQSIIESSYLQDNKSLDSIVDDQKDNRSLCQVNYSFNRTKNKHAAPKYKTPIRTLRVNYANSESKIRENNPLVHDDPSSHFKNIPKTYLVKYNVTPAPMNYSISALEQEKTTYRKVSIPFGFSKSRIEKCDFFYPYSKKEFEQGYHNNLSNHNYSYFAEQPSFSFGKTSSRDQSSYLKSVVGILNNIKEQRDQQKIHRRQTHALKEYLQEEQLKRNMNKMLPSEQQLQNQNKSYNRRQMDIEIKQNSDQILSWAKQQKRFWKEVDTQVEDPEFKFKGQLKQSFATTVNKYPAVKDPFYKNKSQQLLN